MKQAHRFKRTTLIIAALFAFLPGLGLARTGLILPFIFVILSAIFVSVSARKRNMLTFASVILFGLALGVWRGNAFMKQLEPYRELSGKQVIFIARVQSDAVYSYQGQLSFDVTQIEFQSPRKATVSGRITVRGFGERAVYRGDILQIEGKLSDTKGSRQARIAFSNFKAVERDKSLVESTRRSFVAGISTALPEPSAPFGLGLLIGYRTTLPEITSEQLAITGLTHIIAVSGYNLTIIVRGSRRLLKKRSKYQQAITCVVLILLFLLVTDFSASIVRASIISGLSLLAWYYGRRFKPLLILGLAAAITAGWSPLYVWSDIGWYLSFLAFFGILIISPLAVRRIYGRRKEPSQLVLILIETSAAQLMTAPIILYIFGRASLIGLVSNLVIGPLVPLAMILTLSAGLAGMFVPILSGFIAWPARILLRYMLEVVGLFARVPNALVERAITLPYMLGMYVIIAVVTLLAWRKVLSKYGTITDNDLSI
ncbi:ComEC/Rec2 family competence protein [Candidatus Saccharibacteria bacterium]|nr:ComEC/Rec2 family competence protein [Candidatus Saccharibacteria bacterium]